MKTVISVFLLWFIIYNSWSPEDTVTVQFLLLGWNINDRSMNPLSSIVLSLITWYKLLLAQFDDILNCWGTDNGHEVLT